MVQNQATAPRPAEVFISYSQKDRELVAPIAALLAELGVDAWFDRELSAGERFADVIGAKLKEVKAVLICWSPQAIESHWVKSEAEHAREAETYVPIFIAPCRLMPPFNGIHTEDLSNWNRSTNDPAWLKIVARISKLIGRDGVAAGARALASGDEKALYDFARRCPDEPAARKIWSDAETRHRAEFGTRLDEARSAAVGRAARIKAEAADLDARIEATVPAFESWLVDEWRGAAQALMPDPLAIIERQDGAEKTSLRSEIASMSGALARARTREDELVAEMKARERELDAAKIAASAELKAHKQELDAANVLIANLSAQLEAAKSSRLGEPEFAPSKAVGDAGTAPAAEKGKPRALLRRIWTLCWTIGFVISLVLAAMFRAYPVNADIYYI